MTVPVHKGKTVPPVFRHSFLLIVILLVLASLFPLVTAYRYPAFLNDDSYITLTYTKNLVNGRGFVFNYPPAVLGTTSPLFTIVVAGLAYVFRQTNIQIVAVFLTAFCWLGIVWVVFLFREEWGLEDWQTGIVGLVVIGSGWIGFLGMEAYPFALLMVLSLSLFFSGRYFLTGLFTGLLFLTRGEGILVLGVILITETLRQWRKRKRIDTHFVQANLNIIFGFAIPLSFWFLYAHFSFGSFLPNTLAAKQAQLQNGSGIPFGQRLTSEWMPLWGKSFAIEQLPFINLWWVIVLIGVFTALFQKRRWLVFAGWITLYVSGYILLSVSAYWWYQLPILFVLQLFFGLGIVKLIETLKSCVRPFHLYLSMSVLLGSALLFLLTKPTIHAMVTYKGDARGESYTALSQWFRENSESFESIAFIEIGYLGYYTNNRIIDLAGLTLPDIVPHIAKKDFAWGFWHYQPDYYIHLSDFDWALGSIKADPRFDQQYQPVAALPGPRDANFVIYKRVSK